MDQRTLALMTAAEKAVARVVGQCVKTGALYAGSPRAVAQVSRTGKWLRNALAALRRELDGDAAGAGTKEE